MHQRASPPRSGIPTRRGRDSEAGADIPATGTLDHANFGFGVLSDPWYPFPHQYPFPHRYPLDSCMVPQSRFSLRDLQYRITDLIWNDQFHLYSNAGTAFSYLWVSEREC